MKLWLYCDEKNRLQGMNPNDMRGNTGWIEAVDASILGENPMRAQLHDSRGIARYKAPGGVVTARSQEEMDAEYNPPVTPVNPNDYDARITALEKSKAEQSDVDALTEAIERGLSL